MPTQEKIDRVNALKEKLEQCTIALTANYTGIGVNEMVDLRRRMRAVDVEFTVVKNTLMYLAADAAKRPQVKDIVQGTDGGCFWLRRPGRSGKSGVGIQPGDPVDAGRPRRSAAGRHGAAAGPGEAGWPRCLARSSWWPALMGQLQAPVQRLVNVLNGPLQNLGSLLQARIRQLEAAE